jgi:DNA-binding Lrp family transcriptional regulator
MTAPIPTRHTAGRVAAVRYFDLAVADLPELVEASTLAGDTDALIRLRVSDEDHLKRVIDRVRCGKRGSAKVTGTRTLIVLGTTTGAAGTRT